MTRHPHSSRQKGLALLIVLWALVLMTVIGLSFSYAVRVESQSGVALSDRVRAEATAAAGIRRAILGALSKDPELGWKSDGQTYEIPWPDATLRISMRMESGKIDLNKADPKLLAGLFELVLGEIPEADPEVLAAQVVDWRDRDDDRTMHGAEAEEYRAVGREHAPRNSDMDSVGELAQVLDFNGNMVRLLEPYLTVNSGRPRVDPSSAGETVLAAIPGIDIDTAAAFVAERDARIEAGEKIDTSMLRAGKKYLEAKSGSGVLSISAEARLNDGGRATIEATVRVGGRGQPYEIVDWRFPLPGLDDHAAGTEQEVTEQR